MMADAHDQPPAAAPRFAWYVTVRYHEMDALGHVNNAVYLHYLEQAAIEHAAALGYDMARLRALGGVFIAHRHEIDYLRPATAGDTLQVVTWATAFSAAGAVREYTIHAYPAAAPPPVPGLLPPGATPTGDLLVRARTRWVWIDPERGRPRRIPTEMAADFLTPAGRTRGHRGARGDVDTS